MVINKKPFVAKAEISIDAPIAKVWDALVNPEQIKKYMFGTTVVSDWVEGGPIVWKGQWKGSPYEDKGVILRLREGGMLQYSHFSPLAGMPDAPENYHTVTIELFGVAGQTRVSLSQDNNLTYEARREAEKNWLEMLTGMKKLLDRQQVNVKSRAISQTTGRIT